MEGHRKGEAGMEKVGVPSKQSVKGRAACLLELGLAQSSTDRPPTPVAPQPLLPCPEPTKAAAKAALQGSTARGWTQDSRRPDASGGPWGLMKMAVGTTGRE